MESAIVMVFLTVPAEARSEALHVLTTAEAIGGYPGAVASTAASFVESEGTRLRDRELILVSARAEGTPSPELAETFWRAVESTLFGAGISAVEHMTAYAVPG
jgi:hypothetical protein